MKQFIFRFSIWICFLLFSLDSEGQSRQTRIDSFEIHGDIRVAIDRPVHAARSAVICFFALPNGNSIAQTMGKKMQPGDDWHFDIQHIRAQTQFIRSKLKNKDFVVIYLANSYKSWPSWKVRHMEFRTLIPHLVDSLSGLISSKKKEIYLNGHSGGGSFIFGYLLGVPEIPDRVKRISFLDSNYGYDSVYYPKLKSWLTRNKNSALNVFAYNDSIALLNGKSFVSPTGGTWYRSHLMIHHLSKDFSFTYTITDSLGIYNNKDARIRFYLKFNFNRGIYHTQQVERNGFIHSVLCGTKHENSGYSYYGNRAYENLIE